MAAFVSTDVTVALVQRDIIPLGMSKKMTFPSITFGGGPTYHDTTKVPMPAVGVFGFRRAIERVFIEQPANGYIYHYDRTNNRIRIFLGAAVAIGVANHVGVAPTGNVAAPVFTGAALANITPAGNLSDLQPGAFTGTPISPGTPAGNLSDLQPGAFTGAAASFGAKIDRWSIQNLKGADADVAGSMTADQNAGPTNDDLIDTLAVIAAGAWAYTENLEIDIPRNVCLTLLNDSGGDLNMEDGVFSAVITGTFRGQVQTDTITETFTGGPRTIVNTKYRWKYGVKPFDHITDVVVTGISIAQNGIKIGIGVGRLLGVPVEPKDGVAADFVKITKNSVSMEPVVYNDTHKTLDLGALADNDDFDIEVEVASIGESYTPAGNVANGTGVFTGAAMTNITPAGTIANGTGVFTGAALAPGTPAGNCSAPAFTGSAPANFVHTITGNTAEAPLAEMDAGVAPAAVTLYTQMIGQ